MQQVMGLVSGLDRGRRGEKRIDPDDGEGQTFLKFETHSLNLRPEAKETLKEKHQEKIWPARRDAQCLRRVFKQNEKKVRDIGRECR